MFGRDKNKPFTFNQDRARGEFFESLECDTLKEISFSADTVSRLILSSKVNKKTTIAAVTESYKSQYSSVGYGTNLSMLTTIMRDLPEAFHALEQFISDTKQLGFDQTTDETSEYRETYDSEISHAIINEGLLRQYCVPLSLSSHARSIATGLWKALQESSAFQTGLAVFETVSKQEGYPSSQQNQELQEFDHQMLSALYFIRRLCNDVALNEQDPNLRLRGPTAWSLRGFETLLLQQFITHFPTGTWNQIHTRYTDLVDKVHFQDYTLGDLKSIGEKVRFMTSISRCLKDAHTLLQEKAVFAVHHERISELQTPDVAESVSSHFRINPPRCSITVALPNFLQSESSMHVTLIGTMLTFQLINKPDSYALRWTLDQENCLRTTSRVYHVPYYHEDIGISQEKFGTWKGDLEQVSNEASAGLYSFLEQYPGLYSPDFDNSTHVFINTGESEITFSCESLNRDVLESAIRSGLQDVECEISEQEPVEQQESSFFNVTFPRAETADTTVEPSLTTNQEIDDYFVSHYCNDYRTLVSLLVKFGVYESMGKGSHEGLNKDGYKYPTSQKLRSGRINLTPKLVKEILSYLKISPQEFINRALRVDRTTANHKPSLQDPKYLPS